MPIVVTLGVMLARRRMRSKQLAERIGVTEQNLAILKSGKGEGVRFDTLASICEVLDCQPVDILAYRAGPDDFHEGGQSPDGGHLGASTSPPTTFDSVPLQPSAP